MTIPMQVPTYDADFYSDEFILDPLPHYRKMRKLGPVIWLAKHENYALTHYATACEALRNHDIFCSGRGVAADAFSADFMKGNTLASDPPRHTKLRAAIAAPLVPGALSNIQKKIQKVADGLIDDLVARDTFDAITDLSRHLPYTIVRDLVGLPDMGQERQVKWAAAAFDALGIQNKRGKAAIKTIEESREYFCKHATREALKPGSWTHRIHELVDMGCLDPELAPYAIRDYVNPSLDSTIAATGYLIWYLANSPDQWALLKQNPELIEGAVNEAVRLGSPARAFTRQTRQETELAGITIPADQRVMILFACANRDEAVFENPDVFDVTRNKKLHLGFGSGIHMCVGMHLAQLEMKSLLRAMITRVKTIEVGEPIIGLNNTINTYAQLPAKFIAEDRNISLPSIDIAATSSRTMQGQIVSREIVATDIVCLEIALPDGGILPHAEPGAHLDVYIRPGLIRQYSLTGKIGGNTYRIAVQKEADSQGGSVAMHDKYTIGAEIEIGMPRNHFVLIGDKRPKLLFAGGIGLTPLLAMAWQLYEDNVPFALHISIRSQDRLAFGTELAALPFAESVHIYSSADGQRVNIATALAAFGTDVHVYTCGPKDYMAHVQAESVKAGVPDVQCHFEYFGAEIDTDGASFKVTALRSKVEFTVNPGETILDKLVAHGISTETSCRKGVCGSCLTKVVKGIPDHRDMVQTDVEKAANSQMTVCCSRSKSKELVLDI